MLLRFRRDDLALLNDPHRMGHRAICAVTGITEVHFVGTAALELVEADALDEHVQVVA